MKKTIITSALLISIGFFGGCSQSDARGLFKDPPTKALTILYDVTDPMAAMPNSDEIIEIFGFKNEDIYLGYTFRIRQLSTVNLTTVNEISITSQNKLTGDEIKRVAVVKNFRKRVKSQIDSTSKLSTMKETYSVIYKTVAQEINHIATIKADEKKLIIYSDLVEHSSDANFYSETGFTELRHNPKGVIARLEKIVPIGDLKGVKIYVVFKPKSYEEESRFKEIYSMYKTMLEAKGAQVYVGANLIIH